MRSLPSVMGKQWMQWAVLLACCAGWTGCLYQDLEVLEVGDFSDVQLSLEGLESQMDVVVYNPNPYAVNLVGADISLAVGDQEVGVVSLSKVHAIRPQAQSTVPLFVQTQEGALGKVLKNDLMRWLRGEPVPFSANGTVTGKAFGVRFNVPLRHDQSLNIRR